MTFIVEIPVLRLREEKWLAQHFIKKWRNLVWNPEFNPKFILLIANLSFHHKSNPFEFYKTFHPPPPHYKKPWWVVCLCRVSSRWTQGLGNNVPQFPLILSIVKMRPKFFPKFFNWLMAVFWPQSRVSSIMWQLRRIKQRPRATNVFQDSVALVNTKELHSLLGCTVTIYVNNPIVWLQTKENDQSV